MLSWRCCVCWRWARCPRPARCCWPAGSRRRCSSSTRCWPRLWAPRSGTGAASKSSGWRSRSAATTRHRGQRRGRWTTRPQRSCSRCGPQCTTAAPSGCRTWSQRWQDSGLRRRSCSRRAQISCQTRCAYPSQQPSAASVGSMQPAPHSPRSAAGRPTDRLMFCAVHPAIQDHAGHHASAALRLRPSSHCFRAP